MAYEASGNGSGDPKGFELYCRGDVRLYSGDADCTPRSKKGRALLAILAAEQRPLSRVKIIDLLWSDRQEEQARASLRTLLADLKSQFNSRFDDLLTVERERIALGPAVRTDLTDPTLARPAGELFEGLDHIDPELDEWLRVEREKWTNVRPSSQAPAEYSAVGERRPKWRSMLPILLVVILLAGGLYAWRQSAARIQPVIAVLPFEDLTGRNAPLAAGVAEQMRIELAQNPKIQVIAGRSSDPAAIEGERKLGPKEFADRIGATHLLEATILPHEGQLKINFSLTDGRSGSSIWNQAVAASPDKILGPPVPVSATIAEFLTDVVADALPPRAMRADAASYHALFRARALLREDNSWEEALQARQILFEVLTRYPEFVPALITMADSTMRASTRMNGPIPLSEARTEAARFARRAIALAPQYGPAYSSLGSAYQERPESFEFDRKAVALSPGAGWIRANLGSSLGMKGDWPGALAQYRIAAKLDPLDIGTNYWLAFALLANDRRREARSAVDQFLARHRSPLLDLKFRAEVETTLFGDDYSTAYIRAVEARRRDPADPWAAGNLFRVAFNLFGPRAALPHAEPGSLAELVLKNDKVGLERKVKELGADFWGVGWQAETAAHYLLNHGGERTLASAYDQARRSGKPVDDPVFKMDEIVVLLRRLGRHREADETLKFLARELQANKSGPQTLAIDRATVSALAGRREEAIQQLRIAHQGYWWARFDSTFEHPYASLSFAALRKDRRFAALVADFDGYIAKERAEAQTELRRRRLA